MKVKVSFLLLALAAVLVSQAQQDDVRTESVDFGQYFADSTLRFDYYRIGNRQSDSIEFSGYALAKGWSGSLTQMIDPFDNGDYRVMLQDKASGKVIYSRCYNTIFREYRDTPAGKDSVVSYEEVLRMPWPKKPVNVLLQKRDSNWQFYTTFTMELSPSADYCILLESAHIDTLLFNGDPHKKMDVVIVPEGYGPGDEQKMHDDLAKFAEYLFAWEPFASRKSDFNVWGVKALARERGITDPNKNIKVNSAVGASYNTFGADRYLMTFALYQLHDIIAQTPCDHIVIMANSDTYGGGAIYNFYAISSLNSMAPKVLTHELGHSIGGLADEYVDESLSYGDMHALDMEPVEPNITTLVHFDSKWKDMLPKRTLVPTPANMRVQPGTNGPLGVYEGAGYHAKGIYRPTMHCMMRDYAPFCPVCAKRLNQIFDLYTK